jgi:hypothetical protein
MAVHDRTRLNGQLHFFGKDRPWFSGAIAFLGFQRAVAQSDAINLL